MYQIQCLEDGKWTSYAKEQSWMDALHLARQLANALSMTFRVMKGDSVIGPITPGF